MVEVEPRFKAGTPGGPPLPVDPRRPVPGSALSRRGGLRPKSKNRVRLEAASKDARRQFIEDRVCERCSAARATEIHHREGRAVAPDLIWDRDNWVALCSACHRWVTDAGDAAVEEGWVRRNGYELRRSEGPG